MFGRGQDGSSVSKPENFLFIRETTQQSDQTLIRVSNMSSKAYAGRMRPKRPKGIFIEESKDDVRK